MIPPVPAGVPQAPDHLLNHPQGAYTSRLKQLGWNAVLGQVIAFVKTGKGPEPWCGRRPGDGALMYFIADLALRPQQGKSTKVSRPS